MAKPIFIYNVLVSSPSDVSEERSIIEELIGELNPHFHKAFGFELRPLRWETAAIPGLSKGGPQGVIDQQMPDDYDVYIGVLGARYGTPVNDAGSGTEHEFHAALSRWENDNSSVRILFYFKENPGKISEIDAEQLGRVQAFRERIRQLGLYKLFNSSDEFRAVFHGDLLKLASQLVITPPSNSAVAVEVSSDPVPNIEPDLVQEAEDGFLDLVESAILEAGKATRVLNAISVATESFGNQIYQHTQELSAATERNAGATELKRIINSSALQLASYSSELSNLLPDLTSSMEKSLKDYGGAVSLLVDYGGDQSAQITEAFETVAGLRGTIDQNYEKVSGLMNSIESTPRATSAFNRAKRDALKTLDELLLRLIRISELASAVERLMQQTLSQLAARGQD